GSGNWRKPKKSFRRRSRSSDEAGRESGTSIAAENEEAIRIYWPPTIWRDCHERNTNQFTGVGPGRRYSCRPGCRCRPLVGQSPARRPTPSNRLDAFPVRCPDYHSLGVGGFWWEPSPYCRERISVRNDRTRGTAT